MYEELDGFYDFSGYWGHWEWIESMSDKEFEEQLEHEADDKYLERG